ncbi:MAG: hypothetical protein ABIG68_06555, partial [Acidobacteriota bacterium]
MINQHAACRGRDTLGSIFRTVSLGLLVVSVFLAGTPAASQERRLTLEALVQPSTVFYQDGQAVKF